MDKDMQVATNSANIKNIEDRQDRMEIKLDTLIDKVNGIWVKVAGVFAIAQTLLFIALKKWS